MEMGIETGTMTREQADAYLAELSDSRGDMFLNFLTDDLHPRIERDYGTAPSGHGLFGYSYGGLFSLYAWLTKSTFFESIGAGSPASSTGTARSSPFFEPWVTPCLPPSFT